MRVQSGVCTRCYFSIKIIMLVYGTSLRMNECVLRFLLANSASLLR